MQAIISDTRRREKRAKIFSFLHPRDKKIIQGSFNIVFNRQTYPFIETRDIKNSSLIDSSMRENISHLQNVPKATANGVVKKQ